MKKYLVEFIGTFFLVFTIGMAVRSGFQLAPLATGASLMVMIFAGGRISGGHFNPAGGLGLFMMGLEKLNQIWVYLGADLLGGAVAAMTCKVVNGNE